MTVDVPPEPVDRRNLRASDADRERVASALHEAAGAGRLTLSELDERLAAVYAARTYAELEPLLADQPDRDLALPTGSAPVPRAESVELRQMGGGLVRRGAWIAPRRVLVTQAMGSSILDYSEAVISDRELEVVLNTGVGDMTIVVPSGSSVDVDGLQVSLGSLKNRVPGVAAPGGVRFRVSGEHRVGSVKIVHPKAFRLGRLEIRIPWQVRWHRR